VAGSLVLVNQATGGHAVQKRHRGAVAGAGGVGVTGANGRQHALDSGTQRRATAGVVGTAVVVLTGALDGLRAVGHGEIPASKTKKRPRIMRIDAAFVNQKNYLQAA
jgi:hypothetical protein